MSDLRITEIFYSLQGESTFVGLPTVFIRLTGCPLRCQYCDTAYAFSGGKKWTFESVLSEVSKHQPKYVCVSGGEPLAQPNCFPLLTQLCDAGYTVSLETSGAMDVAEVDPRVVKILDIKTPDSKEEHRNLWSNIDHLLPHDQAKFVICSRGDFDYAVAVIEKYNLSERVEVLISPSYHEVTPELLSQWVLEKPLNVRMQVQLHKIIWGEKEGV